MASEVLRRLWAACADAATDSVAEAAVTLARSLAAKALAHVRHGAERDRRLASIARSAASQLPKVLADSGAVPDCIDGGAAARVAVRQWIEELGKRQLLRDSPAVAAAMAHAAGPPQSPEAKALSYVLLLAKKACEVVAEALWRHDTLELVPYSADDELAVSAVAAAVGDVPPPRPYFPGLHSEPLNATDGWNGAGHSPRVHVLTPLCAGVLRRQLLPRCRPAGQARRQARAGCGPRHGGRDAEERAPRHRLPPRLRAGGRPAPVGLARRRKQHRRRVLLLRCRRCWRRECIQRRRRAIISWR